MISWTCFFLCCATQERAPDHLLPKNRRAVGMGAGSRPLFIKTDVYGTRSSTVLLMSEKSIYMQERTFTGDKGRMREFSWELPEK